MAIGVFERLFFAGMMKVAGAVDWDYGIYCVESDGSPCTGFGINGFVSYAPDLGAAGAYRNDIVRRIVAYSRRSLVVQRRIDAGRHRRC